MNKFGEFKILKLAHYNVCYGQIQKYIYLYDLTAKYI